MQSPGFLRSRAAWASCLIVLAGLSAASAQTEAPPPRNTLVFHVSEKTAQLAITEKDSRLIELDARIKTVDGFDPAIVKITTVDNFHQVRLLALTPGYTSVVVVDEHGVSYTVEVLVSGDVKQLEAVIRKAAPGSSVQALKVKDNVLLLGWVDQPSEATKIVELAEQFHPKVLNYLQVSGMQTITLRVKVMESQRQKIRDLGFNFLQTRQHSYVGSLPGALTPFAPGNPVVSLGSPFGHLLGPLSSSVNPAQATAVFGLVAGDNAFQGFVEALQKENLVKILAEPNLTTINGRPASFLVGGQFPVPVPQGLGTVSVVYKPFGVQLEFVPTIIGSGRLRIQVRPEVSDRDFSNSIIVSGINVPSLTTRTVNTEVEMNYGETLVLAGIINNRVVANTQKIPFLGELPWIGAAFRRVHHDEQEQELLVLVTPELSAPTDESQLPEGPGRSTVVPTDRELYFNGYLETPRYAPDPEPDVSMYSTGGFVSPPGYGMPGAGPAPIPGRGAAAPDPLPSYDPPPAGVNLPPQPAAHTPNPPAAEAAPDGAEVTPTSGTALPKKSAALRSGSGKGTGKSKATNRSVKSASTPYSETRSASVRPGLISP